MSTDQLDGGPYNLKLSVTRLMLRIVMISGGWVTLLSTSYYSCHPGDYGRNASPLWTAGQKSLLPAQLGDGCNQSLYHYS